MFRNKIPEPCWIPEEPHQEVWNRTIRAGCGCEGGFTFRRVNPAELERVFATVVKLSDALKNYWISSGNAAAAEQCKRDFEKSPPVDDLIQKRHQEHAVGWLL